MNSISINPDLVAQNLVDAWLKDVGKHGTGWDDIASLKLRISAEIAETLSEKGPWIVQSDRGLPLVGSTTFIGWVNKDIYPRLVAVFPIKTEANEYANILGGSIVIPYWQAFS